MRFVDGRSTMRRRTLAAGIAALTMALTAGIALADAEPTPPPLPEPTVEPAPPTPGMAAVSYEEEIAATQRAYRTFTLKSPQTKRMRGVLPSLYRGQFFDPKLEDRRLCIVERESNGHYDVVSPGGAYFGAYQMSAALGVGATWMMLDEHKELLGPAQARAILADLRERPVHTWPRYWQDAAFSTVHNWEGSGSGAEHWAGGRWSC